MQTSPCNEYPLTPHFYIYCRFGNFRVTFISRIFDFRIISEFLNSRASIESIKIAISNQVFSI